MGTKSDHLWGIVLAGGDGQRLRKFIHGTYGSDRPKQFCAITGRRSMLQHTHDRVRMLIDRQHLLTVAKEEHRTYLREQLTDGPAENVLLQPVGRETGAAVLLALLDTCRRDPEAVIAIFPSDQFILEERIFMEHVQDAFACSVLHPDSLVLLGVDAEFPETEYGWIERGEEMIQDIARPVHRVKRFWEKPDEEAAKMLYARECLWNTSVVVGYGRTLLNAYAEQTPQLFESFQMIAAMRRTGSDGRIIEDIYEAMPSVNFSRSILERVPEILCVMKVSDVHWSDWGSERRIRNDLSRFDLRLSTSVEPLNVEKRHIFRRQLVNSAIATS